jgi:broad-specificity NMP kinase
VEFLGLPGAGKSGVSRRVGEILQGEGIRVVETAYELTHRSGVAARRFRKSAFIAREIVLRPMDSARSARAIVATKQNTTSDLVGAVSNWLLVSNLLRDDGRVPAIHLLDEGIFQALWSVGFGAAVDDLTLVSQAVGTAFPVPDVVVIVNASLATVEQRLRCRGMRQSRLEDRLGIDRGIFEKSERLMGEVRTILVEMAKSRKNVHIHEVANDREQDLEPNARALAAVLIPMFAGRS